MRESDGILKINKDTNVLKKDADFLNHLDEDQVKPVKDIFGPSLVVAGAGSGKTRVVVYRVANMIYNDIDPKSILMMTFTNKAAREMKDRIGNLIGNKVNALTCGTYHHVGNLILRKYAHLIGLKSNYNIMDDDDVKSLLKLSRLNVDPKNKLIPKERVLKEIISLSINKGNSIDEIIKSQFPDHIQVSDTIKEIAKEYMKLKIKSNVVDYDDILLYWKLLLQKNESVRERLIKKYSYLLIDEFQDSNKLQYDIVKLMVGENNNIMVVGDPDQSIYSWRGAKIDNILNFKKDFEGCKKYHVGFNYRSNDHILKLANSSIKNNIKRSDLQLKPKNFGGMIPSIICCPDTRSEAEYVVQTINELIEEGIPLKNIAILYRNHYFAKDVEIELTKNNIPYELRSGMKFFEKKHIKDVVSFIRMMYNPKDEISWARILQQLEGVGDKTIKTILNSLLNHDNIIEFIKNERDYKFVKRGKDSFIPFMEVVRKSFELSTVQEIINNFLNMHYEQFIKLNFENYEDRINDIKSLIDYSFKYNSIEQFLDDISLLEEVYAKDDVEEDKKDKDRIILSTIHRSKGLEWKHVFLLGCTEGKFPSIKSEYDVDYLEEERRLFYVATTRAEQELYITYTSTEYDFHLGIRNIVKPSKFLLELPENTYQHFKLES